MAEELDLEGKVLDARVRQKKDTLANWDANELILLDGEQAFVVDANGQPINFKIGDGTKKFADLPYWIAYDQGQYVAITGTALPTPTATVGYSIVPEGTYTRAGQANVVVPAGNMGVLNFGANTWSLGSSVPLPQTTGVDVIDPVGDALPKEKAVNTFVGQITVNKLSKDSIDDYDIYKGKLMVNTRISIVNGAGSLGYEIGSFTTQILNPPVKTIYLSDIIPGGSDTSYRAIFYDNGGQTRVQTFNYTNVKSLTLTESEYGVQIWFKKPVDSNVVLDRFKVLTQSTNKVTAILGTPIPSVFISSNNLYSKDNVRNDFKIQGSNGYVAENGSMSTQPIKIDASKSVIYINNVGDDPAGYWLGFFSDLDGLSPIANSGVIVKKSEGVKGISIPSTAKTLGLWLKKTTDTSLPPNLYIGYSSSGTESSTTINIDGKEIVVNNGSVKPILNSITVSTNASAPSPEPNGWYSAYTVVPNVDGQARTLGCTGMDYNRFSKEFIVAEYGFAYSSRILFFKKDNLVPYTSSGTTTPVPDRSVDIFTHLQHIQGLAFDEFSNEIIVAGSFGAQTPANNTLCWFDYNGNFKKKLNISFLGEYQLGMVAVDPITRNYIIKFNNNNYIFIINRNTLQLIETIDTGIYYEGLGFDRWTGEMWVAGDLGKVRKYESYRGGSFVEWSFQTFPNENNRSNVEGMTIIEDGTLVMSADCFLHGATNNGNGLYLFNFNGTARQKIRATIQSGNGNITPLSFKKWELSNTYLSEVIDTGSTASAVSVSDSGYTVTYRGSSTQSGVYSAAWSSSVPSTRFIQVKVSVQ